MKNDIFHGKIKKEYFAYILIYMIFIALLLMGIGVLFIYGVAFEMTTNSLGERIFMAVFGGGTFALAFVYVFLEMLVIRNYPKYTKLRRALFNSDCYFTQSNSNEYHGSKRRRDVAAHELVIGVATLEKTMGEKPPFRYKLYITLFPLMSVIGGVGMFSMFALASKKNDPALGVLGIGIAIVFVVLAFFFLMRAMNVALNAPLEKIRWKSELINALCNIAAHKNNKKRKYRYDEDQLPQIEALVQAESKRATLRLVKRGRQVLAFEVVELSSKNVIFKGIFT